MSFIPVFEISMFFLSSSVRPLEKVSQVVALITGLGKEA
jgi:hypothetical protein